MRSLMTVYEITQKKILTLINFQPSQIGFRSLSLSRTFIQSSKNNPIYRIFIDFYPIFMLNERKNHTENFQLIFREVLNAQKIFIDE